MTPLAGNELRPCRSAGRGPKLNLFDRSHRWSCPTTVSWYISGARRLHPVRGKDKSPPAVNNSFQELTFVRKCGPGHTKGISSCQSDVYRRIPTSSTLSINREICSKIMRNAHKQQLSASGKFIRVSAALRIRKFSTPSSG